MAIIKHFFYLKEIKTKIKVNRNMNDILQVSVLDNF